MAHRGEHLTMTRGIKSNEGRGGSPYASPPRDVTRQVVEQIALESDRERAQMGSAGMSVGGRTSRSIRLSMTESELDALDGPTDF
eukprot:9393673-Pyramimonas_sp.AAC.1